MIEYIYCKDGTIWVQAGVLRIILSLTVDKFYLKDTKCLCKKDGIVRDVYRQRIKKYEM